MALHRLYLDAESAGCDHVKFTAYLDSGRTQKVGQIIMTIADLKREALDEDHEQEIKNQVIYIAKKAYGNTPSTTKAQLRTAIRAFESWV